MTTATHSGLIRGRFARTFALCLLALAATLAQSREARAQWTTSGVTTSTTNRVGVGTPDPTHGNVVGSMFTVATADDTATAFATSNGKLPRFALNNHSDGSWTMYDYAGNTGWNIGITQRGGSVGIGTVAPQSLLDVSGASGMTLRNSGASTGFSFFDRASVPGDQVVFQGNAGNYSLFNVSTRGANFGTERASGMAFWTVDINNTANATQFQMQYTPAFGPVFFTQKFGTGAQGDKKISFQTVWQNTAVTPTQLVLDTNGSVGIGTATPSAGSKLHVAGNITVDGNINAKYQDVAEWVPTKQKLSAGTVVVLDTAELNHVREAARAYDTGVAGVISAQPGIALGEAGEGKVLVATTGRVKVKVDASRGAIKVGDLLVTSDVAGVAMRSQPLELGGVPIHRPGTIIGKALEPLAGGTGEILVLLSLQ